MPLWRAFQSRRVITAKRGHRLGPSSQQFEKCGLVAWRFAFFHAVLGGDDQIEKFKED